MGKIRGEWLVCWMGIGCGERALWLMLEGGWEASLIFSDDTLDLRSLLDEEVVRVQCMQST